MKQFFCKALVSSLLFVSTSILALENKTEEFQNFLRDRFVGLSSSTSDSWDYTTCVIPNPIGGGCSQKGGYKIYGGVTGRISSMDEVTGKGVILNSGSNPFTGETYNNFWIDQSFKFTYQGQANGHRQCYPGSFECGTEWSDLDFAGRVIVDIAAGDSTGFNINIRYEVFGNHDDRPNRLGETAMRKLANNVKDIVASYCEKYGVKNTIVLREP